MGGPVIALLLGLLGGLALPLAGGAAEPERVFLTYGYRYQPATEPPDEATADIGLALCGTRCNALSGIYESYLMSPGWRMVQVEGVNERVVDLDNPFLDGKCVCTGEEYEAERYYYRPGVAEPGSRPRR